jgi:hypothetical protein
MRFFSLIGIGGMMIGTIITTRKCYRTFLCPREPACSGIIGGTILAFAGAITYVITLVVTDSWTAVAFLAIGLEWLHFLLAAFGIWRECKRPAFVPTPMQISVRTRLRTDAPFTPGAGEAQIEEPKREEENATKESISVFVSPYDEIAAEAPAMRRDISVEIEIGNLPRGDAIQFPDQAGEDRSLASA